MDYSQLDDLFSLYLHIPFCTHRCAYCDFNTYAGQESLIPGYTQALCKEIEFIGKNIPDKVNLHTVFFGGGTPSLLTAGQFEQILSSIHKAYDLSVDPEVTIEANPGTINQAVLSELRRLGMNRLSFGVQSSNSEELRMLERSHDFFEVIEAVASARKAGFENLNLDLIYGLPSQSLRTWQTSVRNVLRLDPEHISAYALTLEHGTPFGRWAHRGLMALPDADLAADMYEWACETLEAAGYQQYEISNWAKPGFQCRHNLQYWRALPYLGLGAGAHGYAGGYRYANVLRIKTYMERLDDFKQDRFDFPLGPAAVNHHRQSRRDEMSELMITGLRLTREGVSARSFRGRFGCELSEVFGNEIGELSRLGLLEWAQQYPFAELQPPEVLRLTPRGRLLGNQAFIRFL